MLPQYQAGQAKEYADSKGWQYKEYGEHIVLRECPFCGKRDKLYWNNTNGAFDCKSAACGTKGNYYTLRKSLGDPVNLAPSAPVPVQVKKRYHLADFAKFEAALAENATAMAYLASRGITEESVKSFH